MNRRDEMFSKDLEKRRGKTRSPVRTEDKPVELEFDVLEGSSVTRSRGHEVTRLDDLLIFF